MEIRPCPWGGGSQADESRTSDYDEDASNDQFPSNIRGVEIRNVSKGTVAVAGFALLRARFSAYNQNRPVAQRQNTQTLDVEFFLKTH